MNFMSIMPWKGVARGWRWRREVTVEKEAQESLERYEENDLYLDCGSGYMTIYICQKSWN